MELATDVLQSAKARKAFFIVYQKQDFSVGDLDSGGKFLQIQFLKKLPLFWSSQKRFQERKILKTVQELAFGRRKC